MFGLFKKVTIEDPVLGTLTRSGREWEGQILIQLKRSVDLVIEGTKESPYPDALAAALELPSRLAEMIPLMAEGLLEHLEPYRDALSDPDDDLAKLCDPKTLGIIKSITSPAEAWANSEIEGVEIGRADGKVVVLIRVESIWDEEHRLGCYFENWQFTGLSGSV